MSNRFLIILGVLILGFIGFLVYQNNDGGGSSGGSEDVQASQHTQGAGTANVTLVEYGDFQCPSCAQFYPIVNEVKKEYGDKITFQFRHFPLTQIHQNAMVAHRAAEAAAKQNKFWDMHDILYERQNLWGQSQNAAGIMEDYATELGMNVEQFKNDFQSAEVNAIINADLQAGQALKVSGTPTFVINGEVVDLPTPSLDAFKQVIDEAIANSN